MTWIQFAYRSTAMLVLAVVSTSAAGARTPAGFPVNSTYPTSVTLVCASQGVPDAATGEFTVVARDLLNEPMPAVRVTVDLGSSADLRLCADMLDPRIEVSCEPGHMSASALTDSTGTVRMTLLGASAPEVPGSSFGGRLFIDGVLMAGDQFRIACVDLNGRGGATGADIGVMLRDIGTPGGTQRSDLNHSGSLSGGDIGRMLTIIGSARDMESCLAICP